MYNIDAGLKVHNRFDFKVIDAKTGIVKQEAFAENIVLDSYRENLLKANGVSVTHINVGTGTGEPNASRTTLFNQVIQLTATRVEEVYANPTSYSKYKATLLPEHCIGLSLTEIAMSNYGSLLNHAMITDGEGNQISINKTATDIVEIYGTLYSTISLPDGMVPVQASVNALHNIVHNSAGYVATYVSACLGTDDNPEQFNAGYCHNGTYDNVKAMAINGLSLGRAYLTAQPYVAGSFGRKYSGARFAVDKANGAVLEVGLTNIGRLVLPNAALPNQSYVDVPIATGDGVKKKFELPSLNVIRDTVVTKINGAEVVSTKALLASGVHPPKSLKYRNIDDGYKFNNMRGLKALASDIVFVKNYSSGPAFLLWKESIGTYEPFYCAAGTILYSGVSDYFDTAGVLNGDTLITLYRTGPCAAYHIDRDTMLITAITPEFTIDNTVAAFASAADVYVKWTSSKGVEIFEKINGTWSLRQAISSGSNPGLQLSQDGNVLVINLTVYDWNGTAYIARAALPTIAGLAASSNPPLSDDGTVLGLMTSNTSPGNRVFEWNGTAWSERDTSDMRNFFAANSVDNRTSMSPDCNTLVTIKSKTTDFFTVVAFYWDGTKYAMNAPQDVYLDGCAAGYCTSQFVVSNQAMVVFPRWYDMNSSYIKNGLYVFPTKTTKTTIEFDTPPAAAAAITASYTVKGVHKTEQYVIDVGFTITA